MKALFTAALLALLPLASQAASPDALFRLQSANPLMGSAVTVEILASGAIHATRRLFANPAQGPFAYDGDIGRLDERALLDLQANLAAVMPNLPLRKLSREEKKQNEGCASDGGYTYSVVGARFAGGFLAVRQSINCMVVDLDVRTAAGARAERAASAARAVLDQAVHEHPEIFR